MSRALEHSATRGGSGRRNDYGGADPHRRYLLPSHEPRTGDHDPYDRRQDSAPGCADAWFVADLPPAVSCDLSGCAASSAHVLADCTRPPQQGNDGYAGYQGMFLASPPSPSGKFSRFHLVTDANPSSACLNFTSEGTGLAGALYPRTSTASSIKETRGGSSYLPDRRGLVARRAGALRTPDPFAQSHPLRMVHRYRFQWNRELRLDGRPLPRRMRSVSTDVAPSRQ